MFLIILQVVLVILRLEGTVDWSWWAILCPTLIYLLNLALFGPKIVIEGGYLTSDDGEDE